jgi:hypothetical protein
VYRTIVHPRWHRGATFLGGESKLINRFSLAYLGFSGCFAVRAWVIEGHCFLWHNAVALSQEEFAPERRKPAGANDLNFPCEVGREVTMLR